MNRSASAVWHGTGRDGKGMLTTQSGVLDGTAYSFTTRFEDEKGTNPEELIAAAHAGCFTMALAFALQARDLTPTELKTEAVVSLEKDGAGFKVAKSALTLTAHVPGISQDDFAEIAKSAKEGCPISKLLNAEITLDWSLV
ncbi:MAG: OsmC family protein [Phreatobacter sp.]|uniref:OsmC family protein n=1 Tax=Phreatobacter sp. TaxID=1966341 RepID=UPI002735F40C|nr:OsmC family protein [Phreatobacter sp.]MDP2802030.1 OsmC family protein [Phreatobacter sp.]